MSIAWRLRSVLSPGQRRLVRRYADLLLWPVGSLAGAVTDRAEVALTFDDGPDPDVTLPVLDLLEAHRMRATFFMLSDRVACFPAAAREAAARGHEIALHGDRHDRLTKIPTRELRRRLVDARSRIEDAIGRSIGLFRPPFGAQSLRTFAAARSCGLDVVAWGPFAAEWVDGTPDVVADRAMQGLAPGKILLLHDGLAMPRGEALPNVDRAASFGLLFQRMAGVGLTGTTVGALVAGARREVRTAWFRP